MSAQSRRSVVVLPAPFGPRKPNTSPSRTSRSSPSTATSVPKRFVSFSVRITVCMSRVYWRFVPILDLVTPTDAERKLRELSFLHEVAQLASSARDWDEMLRIVIDRTTDAMRAEVSSLYLLEKRDEVIGVMNVQPREPRDFDRTEIDFLQTIANQVAGIIEKGRLQRESERKLREVSALFEVSNVLTSTLDLDEVLSLIVDRLVQVYPGASGAILLREEGEAVRERAR